MTLKEIRKHVERILRDTPQWTDEEIEKVINDQVDSWWPK